jgi:hypothetical protein
MTEKPKFKLISDGTIGGTKLFYGDVPVNNVTKLKFEVSADEYFPKITAEIIIDEADIELREDSLQLVSKSYTRCEECHRWIVPSIEHKDGKAIASYFCSMCDWRKEIVIDFNYLEKN